MAWQLVTTPKVFRVTPRLAREFAEMTPAPHDRELKIRRLEIYKKIVERKEMRVVTWAKAHCTETNDTYRVNGKHTSSLYNGMNLDAHELFVMVEEYRCDTLEDVAKLYATFDSKVGMRTASDINRSFAASVPKLQEIPTNMINLMVAGINYHLVPTMRGGGSSRATPADRAEVLLDNTKFCTWLYAVTQGETAKTRHIRRAAVVAAMFGSYNKNQRAADEFWREVKDGTNPDVTSASRKLEKFLLTHCHVTGRAENNSRYKIQDREFYVKSIHAWNAWRKKESTNLQYFQDRPIPEFA